MDTKGFSFSLSFAPQPKKEKLSINVFGTQPEKKATEKVFFTEMVDNQIVGHEEKPKELVIPLKKPSWIQKAKERIANEKKEAEAGKPAISAADEARLSILKDFTKNDEIHQESDLVIPLNDRVPILAQNRLPGYNTMDKEEYFQKELDALPEACDVHGDAYARVPIEDFGKAVLRGMGWDGKETVDSSVYEIKPRPDRLGLGAIPLVMDKQRRKSALKKSKADIEASKAYTGVIKETTNPYAFRRGVQVGVVMGEDLGKQGMVLETVPSTAQSVKVLLEGETTMKVFSKSQLVLLNDLVKIRSFEQAYGKREKTPSREGPQKPRESVKEPQRDVKESSRDRSRDRSRSKSQSQSRHHRHHHHHSHR
ncbi:hypothetical protein WA538_000231, partial [Blastocystis sp. DL]